MDYLAIFIAVGSFIFTMYQWVVTASLKRPNWRMLYFDIGKLYVSDDHKSFEFDLDTKNFILANLSDLPNSLVKIDLYCKIGNQWIPADMTYEKEFERMETKQFYRNSSQPGQPGSWDARNEVIRGKEKVKPFPFIVQAHVSESLANYDIYGSFAKFPSQEDLRRLQIRLDLIDQYGKKHSYTFNRKNFPEIVIHSLPDFPEKRKVLGKATYSDEGELSDVVYLTYAMNDEKPEESTLELYKNYKRLTRNSFDISAKKLKEKLQEKPEEQSCENYVDRYTNLLIYKEDGKPKEAEIRIKRNDNEETMKFTLPQEFVELFDKIE